MPSSSRWITFPSLLQGFIHGLHSIYCNTEFVREEERKRNKRMDEGERAIKLIPLPGKSSRDNLIYFFHAFLLRFPCQRISFEKESNFLDGET